MNDRRNFDLSVYFIADPHCCGGRAIEDVVLAAIRGGATMIQLRNKVDTPKIVKAQASSLKSLLGNLSVPFILNDYVDLAAEIGADGVHIGQDDMSAQEARKIIGNDRILGVTAFTADHYAAIQPEITDYVGTGPFFATQTKPDKPVLGADGFRKLASLAPVPVVGIGGITPDNAAQVIKCGANGVAMMRAISEADDPKIAASRFVLAVKGERAA